MLSDEQFLEYEERAKKGDKKAVEIIYQNNIPLIKSIVNKFKNKGIEYDDLYQIASIGLVKSIYNYDRKFNVKFSTYSVPMILGEIKRYIRDNGAIKVSRSLKILANKVNRYIDEFFSENNRQPTVLEISKRFNVDEEDIVFAMDSSKMPLSLYEKYDDDEEGLELIDKIRDDGLEERILDNIQLKNAIGRLTDREKKIVLLRYYKDKTQIEVAEELGVSQVQVSRLENKIIEKIRFNFWPYFFCIKNNLMFNNTIMKKNVNNSYLKTLDEKESFYLIKGGERKSERFYK